VTALALALFAAARDPAIALVACVLAGISWIAVIATLNVSAQLALPAWVRGRGLAIFATVQFAGLAIGSAVWGRVAQAIGLPAAHTIAAIALVALVPLLRRWRLQTGDMKVVGCENDELHRGTVANVARPPYRSDQQISDRPLGSSPAAPDRRIRLHGAWLRQAGQGPGCVPHNFARDWCPRAAPHGMAYDPG